MLVRIGLEKMKNFIIFFEKYEYRQKNPKNEIGINKGLLQKLLQELQLLHILVTN